tara:strand:- start:8054 stop:8701 length:648 start_codon:yes stop_codon:yes gene_type:complete
MSKRLSLAILLSGNGTNLQAIIDSIDSGQLKADIKIVISNNKDAFGLERAKINNIKNLCIDHKDFDDRESFDERLLKEVKQEKIDFIVLAGFMRILGLNFIRNFPNRILNIHPSLLPKYPGLNTHKKVLENKDKEHGVTVHLVDDGLDSGPIIGSMKLKVIDGEKESDLERRIHKIEHYIYPKILSEFQEGKISTTNNKIKIDEVFYENGKEYFI